MAPRPSVRSDLPPLPDIPLVVETDERGEGGYLRLRRTQMRARFPDGTTSEPFRYDSAERERLDAVVVAPHFRDASGRRCVLLRSALRPPAALRPREVWPVPEKPSLGSLWEVPAGLVEADERSEEGLRRCAARELFEETGAAVDASRIEPLGPSTFPSPGVIGERHFYFHAEIDPDRMVEPPEDGSVLERQASIVAMPLEVALALVRKGEIEDAKTEIALRRLAEL